MQTMMSIVQRAMSKGHLRTVEVRPSKLLVDHQVGHRFEQNHEREQSMIIKPCLFD